MGYNGATRTFDTLTDLRNQRGTSNAKANLLGYAAVGDGGEGEFYWDSASIAAEDGGTIFVPSAGSGAGRWKRNYVGEVYPRWFGAKGDNTTNDTAAWNAALAFAAPLGIPINGECKSYKIAAIDLPEKAHIINATFNLTAGTYGLKIGDIGQSPTLYKRDLILRNIIFKGSCTYALIVSTITGVDLKKLLFITVSASNDIMYLLNTYDSEVDRLTFIGSTAGSGGACLNMPAGVNGVTIGRVYTSAFTDYGIRITSGAAINIASSVIQGATEGIYMTGCNGVYILNPYFENVVNPVDIDNAQGDAGGIQIVGGFWAPTYPSHPNIALSNGVYIRYIGGTNNNTLIGGFFDMNSKKLASVGSSAVLNIIRPRLANVGGNTPEVTDYLFKEAGALSSAGFYVEYTRNANAYTTVKRTSDNAQEHVVEYLDSGSNLLRATWSPPLVGDPAAALTFYHIRVAAIRTTSYSLNTADDVVLFNTTANLTATLPILNVPLGKVFIIKRVAGAFSLTVIASGGVVTIDGTTSYSISGTADAVHFQWDGTNYIIISKSTIGSAFTENATLTNTLTLTNLVLNAAYPITNYPPGSKVAYTNLSDEGMSQNIAECTRINATNWYINLTPYKAS